MDATLSFSRRNMPHWLVADRTYFVTMRLAGTIPSEVLKSLLAERRALEETAPTDEAVVELRRRQFIRIEAILDAQRFVGKGLTEPSVATAFFDGVPWLQSERRGWDVYAVTLMSTHVHMVMRNTAGRTSELFHDLAQFKRQTSREINRLLKRKGSYWAREAFDHWCRTERKVLGAIRYTVNNPVKAGLCEEWRDWPWTQVQERWAEAAGL